MTSLDISNIARDLNKNLKSTDFRLRHSVYISHLDGSIMLFKNAFMLRYNDWIIILTAHHGYSTYHVEDLHKFIQLERVNVELLQLDKKL